jgi:hypothetical protein
MPRTVIDAVRDKLFSIKEIERISLELVGAAGEHNEQVEAWQVVVVGATVM